MRIRGQRKTGRVAGLTALALALALALAAGSLMLITNLPAQAAVNGAAMSLSINNQIGTVTIANNTAFTVVVNADAIPAGGYRGVQAYVGFGNTGLINNKNPRALWPDCESAAFVTDQAMDGDGNRFENAGCLTAVLPPLPTSDHKGPILSFDATCDANNAHTIQLLALGDVHAGTFGAGFMDGQNDQFPADYTDDGQGNRVADELTVNCDEGGVGPTATPSDQPCGDVTGDGLANAIDALFVLQLSAGLVQDLPRGVEVGDINGDGQTDSIDAALILQITASLYVC